MFKRAAKVSVAAVALASLGSVGGVFVLSQRTSQASLGDSSYYSRLTASGKEVRDAASGARRAARAMVTWSRLVLDYKLLSRTRPALDSEDLEEWHKYEGRRDECHRRGADLVLELCRKNGGLFIKMAQHAASLRPAVPDIYIERLALLQDRAPHRDLEEVQSMIRKELGEVNPELAEELCEGLDPEPLGSASLAQVHAARLADGSRVAVKVQHPDLDRVIGSDLSVIRALDSMATSIFSEDEFSLAFAVSEFENNLTQELDFHREAANGRRALEIVESHPYLKSRVWIPAVDLSRSTKRILTMELVEGGIPIKQVQDDASRARLADALVNLFAALFFTYGFVHCDPHFGNLLAAPDGRLALIDHGLYRQLDPSFCLQNAHLWRAMVLGDVRGVKRSCHEMGVPQYTDLLPLILTNRPANSSARLGEPIPRTELLEAKQKAGFEQGMSIKQFAEIAQDVPVDMLFLLRTMHLIKDAHVELGGASSARFQAYAKAAAVAPDTYPPSTWTGSFRAFTFGCGFYAHEIKLACAAWMWPERVESSEGARFSLSGMFRERVENRAMKPRKRV